MNNYEKIKSMSVDEMAEFFHSKGGCLYCVDENNSDCNAQRGCIDGIKQWLLAESEG